MLNVQNRRHELDSVSNLPTIPLRVLSMDGQEVDTSCAIWKVRTSPDGGSELSINWLLLDKPERQVVFTERAWYLVKLYLAERLTKQKAGTVCGDYETFLAFERWFASQSKLLFPSSDRNRFDWSDYSEGIARAFLAHGVDTTASKGKNFSKLRAFYRWGVVRQYPDFVSARLSILQSIKAIGNVTGHHVRFRDPLQGPFSPDEVRLISGAIQAGEGRA